MKQIEDEINKKNKVIKELEDKLSNYKNLINIHESDYRICKINLEAI